jgi:acetyl esterase/lipase
MASKVWVNPGGVSAGLNYCIRTFWDMLKKQENPYTLIDAVVPTVERINITTGVHGALPLARWRASVELSQMPPNFLRVSSFAFNDAEWLVPAGYAPRPGEPRLVFIHGGNAQVSALSFYYSGLTSRLANWTDLPVLSCNFATAPLAPYPQNVRNVVAYILWALSHGPRGPGDAGSLVLAADSEGCLVAMQAVLALTQPSIGTELGFPPAVLRSPSTWLKGVVLSSPVVDVACATPSMAWNCFNETGGTGDPDVGNCSETPTWESKVGDCRWSYLSYFYGLHGILLPADQLNASREWELRAEYLAAPSRAPLEAELQGTPPMLILGGTRDYFFSDGPSLAERACVAGVDVEAFNVDGAFHDFIEYSAGCGGPNVAAEGIEAYRRVASFVQRVL